MVGFLLPRKSASSTSMSPPSLLGLIWSPLWEVRRITTGFFTPALDPHFNFLWVFEKAWTLVYVSEVCLGYCVFFYFRSICVCRLWWGCPPPLKSIISKPLPLIIFVNWPNGFVFVFKTSVIIGASLSRHVESKSALLISAVCLCFRWGSLSESNGLLYRSSKWGKLGPYIPRR